MPALGVVHRALFARESVFVLVNWTSNSDLSLVAISIWFIPLYPVLSHNYSSPSQF